MADPQTPENTPAPELAQASPAGLGDAIGKVEVTNGSAHIIRTDGTQVEANAGTPVYAGDTLETSGDGSVGLVFADNSTFSLAEDGRMVIDEMIYDPGTQEGSSVFNVAQGVFTFVSGEIAKTGVDAMMITTPTSTIGIRGTSGGGKVPGADAPESAANTFTLFADPDGTVGEMTITTEGGSQTLSAVNQTTQITSSFLPPSPPVVMPAGAVEKFYAKAAQALPPHPSSQPEGGEAQGTEEGENPEGVEGATEGETEAEAEAEAAAEAEAQAETPVSPEAEAEQEAIAAEAERLAAEVADEAAAEIAQATGSEGGEIEEVAMDAAARAAADALAQGASAEEAQALANTAAITAAQAQARQEGVTEAEINAATEAFDQALANGASLDEAFAAAGNAAEAAGHEARVEIDQAFAEMSSSTFGQGGPFIATAPDGTPQNTEGPREGDGQQGPDTYTNFGTDFTYGDPTAYDAFSFQSGDPFGFSYDPDFGVENVQITFTGSEGPEFGDNQDNTNNDDQTIDVFDETITGFTTGNDTFTGNAGSTRFEMREFGGDDQANGGDGTDEIAFLGLSNAHGVYDATTSSTNPTITFEDGNNSISGTVTLDSVEQIYASDGDSDDFRVGTANSDGTYDPGYGIIIAGDSGDNTITAADGTTLSFTNHTDFVISSSSQNILGGALFGGDGNDTLTAGDEGEFDLFGGDGNDTLNGAGDRDSLYGGDGQDSLVGGGGNDFLSGEAGADTLYGGAGNDALSGGTGGDDLYGNGGSDTLNGGAGVDLLFGGVANDDLTGGAGADRFIFSGDTASNLGLDTIQDFSGGTAFGGGAGDGDEIVLDTSDLGISSIVYEELSWDGSIAGLLPTNVNSNVFVLTGNAGTLADAATAIAAGTALATNAVYLFHDSANDNRLTMVHTDNAVINGTENTLAVFANATDTNAAAALSSSDFDVVA